MGLAEDAAFDAGVAAQAEKTYVTMKSGKEHGYKKWGGAPVFYIYRKVDRVVSLTYVIILEVMI